VTEEKDGEWAMKSIVRKKKEDSLGGEGKKGFSQKGGIDRGWGGF